MRKRPLILIVDNDAGTRALLGRHLRPRFDLLTISRGETLLPLVRRREPDAVIMDVNMPGRDGFRLGRLLHRENRLRPIPILFLSETPDEDEFFATMDTTVAGSRSPSRAKTEMTFGPERTVPSEITSPGGAGCPISSANSLSATASASSSPSSWRPFGIVHACSSRDAQNGPPM